jgi:hypothetical protein
MKLSTCETIFLGIKNNLKIILFCDLIIITKIILYQLELLFVFYYTVKLIQMLIILKLIQIFIILKLIQILIILKLKKLFCLHFY